MCLQPTASILFVYLFCNQEAKFLMSCLKRKIAFRSASKFPPQIAFPKKPSQDPIKKKRKRKKKPSQDSNNQVIPLQFQWLPFQNR